jgi:hypothetical protein
MDNERADIGGDIVSKAVSISSLLGLPILLTLISGVASKSGIEGIADKSARSTADRAFVFECNDRRLSDGDGMVGGIVDVIDTGLAITIPLIVPVSVSVSGSRPFTTLNGVGPEPGLL